MMNRMGKKKFFYAPMVFGKPASGGGGTAMNPVDQTSGLVLSNSNLTVSTTASGVYEAVRSNVSHSSGKFYLEIAISGAGNQGDHLLGFATAAHTLAAGPDASSVGWFSSTSEIDGNTGGASLGTMQAYSVGTVICFAIDLTAQLIWGRVNNGNWNASGTADPATGTGGYSISYLSGPVFAWADINGAAVVPCTDTFNFGATSFAFTAPAGFGNW